MKTLLLSLVVAGSALLIASCGKNVCVGGAIGDCSTPPDPTPNNGNGFTLTPQVAGVYTQQIRIGQVMTLTPRGGRPPYYPAGTTPTGCADVNSANLVTVPTFPISACTIKVVDSSTPSLSATQVIEILPR